ncbi:MAG: hypothetical protein ACKO0V_11175 [bacterium]
MKNHSRLAVAASSVDQDLQKSLSGEHDHRNALVISSTPAGISRTMLNFWIDAALLFSASSMAWVSVMFLVVFPIPTRSEGMKLLGLDFNQWRQIQFGLLMTSSLLALVHLVLHWKWVCGVIVNKILKIKARPDEAIQAVYGVGFFIITLLFMGALIVVAKLLVYMPPPT